MTRTLIVLAFISASAAGAEPPKFGREHLSPTLACAIAGYRYTGAAELAALGGPKDDIVNALRNYRNPGETDDEVRSAAEQAADYAVNHPTGESEQMAEERFAACLREKNLPVDLEAAPKCWRGVRRVDQIIIERKKGTSKETMLERAAAIEAKNETNGKAVRFMVEKVYGWDRSLEELSFAQLLACIRPQ